MKKYRIVQIKDRYILQQKYRFLGITWWDYVPEMFKNRFYTEESANTELDYILTYNNLSNFKIIKEIE